MSFDLSIKILLLGDSLVGKSCFLNQLVNGTFNENEQATLGVEFQNKFLNIKACDNNFIIKCQIWDTSGSKKLWNITRIYYTDCAIIFIFYDITNNTSFNSLPEYVSYIKTLYTNIRIVIIANKTDLVTKRHVARDIAAQFSYNNNFSYYELSCKDGLEVNSVFLENINKLFIDYLSSPKNDNKPLQGIKKGVGFDNKNKDRDCCYII